jgi:hypothetical protein
LRGGKSGTAITADLVAFTAIDPAQTESTVTLLNLRPPVSARQNIETFAPTKARFVRFTVTQTGNNNVEPCIDELEIFAAGKNVALARLGAKATSSGNFANNPNHQLQHINDGKFGNEYSWISNTKGTGWVQIELPATTEIDQIRWGRDRNAKYADRTATQYRIEVAENPDQWQTVATSVRRLAQNFANGKLPEYNFDQLPAEQAKRGRSQIAKLNQLNEQRHKLSLAPQAYIGTFNDKPPATHRLHRGDPMAKRELVAPDTVSELGTLQLEPNTPEQQRRLALANWIATEQNPLTARVIVNRIWQYHFGTGIVSTASDFGNQGTPPTHPQLLDYLANELVEHDWSLKHIQKIILLTKTWQQSSMPRPAAAKIDAATRYLWRFPTRRLEAESIRDSMVSVSGVLNPKRGGPGFSAFEVQLENVRHYFPKQEFGPDDWRRMIYMTKVRQEKDSTFGVFDCPDCNQVMPQRSRSTTPLQALNLFNSRFVLQQATLLSKRLAQQAGDDREKQIRLAYELCYNRPATAVEMKSARSFIQSQSLQQFCRAMLNSNEFLFIP